MSEPDNFDKLLDAMPRIADAVNSFSSPDVQRAAFDALVSTLSIPRDHATDATPPAEPAQTEEPETPTVTQASKKNPGGESASRPRRSKRTAAKKIFTPVRDLNFAPAGKTSLEDFVAEKNPRTLHEKNLVACYYLDEFLETAEITVGHVIAVYKACKWPGASDPQNSLQVTASTKHWLDTGDMGNIKVVWGGKNQIEKMPIDAKGAGKQ